MTEIFKFPIPEAYAEPKNGGIKVTLIYPDENEREYTSERRLSTPADIEFGLQCLEGLLRGERVRIGTPEHPSRPASGAIIDVFTDGAFLSHRRDGGTKVHPWYNGIPSGFPSCREHFENIRLLQQKEGGEESIVLYNGIIILPRDLALVQRVQESIEHNPSKGLRATVETLKRLGIDPRYANYKSVRYSNGNDVLEIKNTQGDTIKTDTGSIYLSWEVETNVAITARREWQEIHSSCITAFDGEGFYKSDYFVYFNREKFLIHPREVANILFGQEIPMPQRYKLKKTEEGLLTAERVLPSEGELYQFKPDDGLRRMLDDLKVPGWQGKWIQYEIEQAQQRLKEL